MKKALSIGLKLSAAPLALGIAVLSQPAFAQDTDETAAEAAAQAETATPDEIVVTGTRIRRDEYTTTEPITVVTSEEITQAGFNSATDALQSAAITQGAGQINNFYGGFVTDGGTGANTLGLRGLGPSRTLILLNGRRLAPGGTRGSVLSADLNVLPTAIVDRIEVLKAGASSVYGSDAIAGVVNILTDTKLRGLNVEAQVNVPQNGAGVDRRVAASFGFDSGRLNVIGSVEYRKRDQMDLGDASFYNCPIEGYLDGEGSALGSGDFIDPATGEPRCFTINNGGVTINTLGYTVLGTNSAGNPALVGVPGIGRTSGQLGTFTRFVPSPGTGGPFPGYLGVGTYDRDSFEPNMLKEPLITSAEIYTGYLSATYGVDGLGNAEIYGELLATRRKSSSPLYRQLSIDYLRNSPLLPVELRNGYFANANNVSSGQRVAARAFVGFGLTDTKQSVDYVRAGGGLRGDFFFPDWRYDAYVGKSWNDGRYEAESFLIDRMANSMNVVQNADDGSFSCVSQASNPNCVAGPALSAAVIGGDLPEAWRDYILENTVGTTKFRETTFAFNIDGPLFSLPGGKAQLALGAEYRRQSINDQPDPESINGNLLGLTSATPTVGKDNVKEVYGELYLPILSDTPFFHRLSLTGSVRYTDYASYGSDTTYKIAAEWEPIRGLGFRGSYGTSYRAPALAEQFLGSTSGFLASNLDPCSGLPDAADQSPTEQIVAGNCASIGLPADFNQTSGISVYRVGGAEAGLAAETSKNWTVGAVLRPKLSESFGDFSLSVDYFDIKVSNGVADLSGQTILNRCYEDTNFNPTQGFCRFVTRDANNALSVTSSYVNLAEDIVKGFDINARYSRDLFNGRFTLNAAVTHYTEQSSRLFPEEYLTDVNGTLTNPNWTGSFDATYRLDDVTLRYGIDWIDGDHHRTYEYFAYDNLTGLSDPDLVQDYRDTYFFEADDYFLHSASVQFNIDQEYEFTFGVQNLFNTKPPRITAAGYTTIGNAPLYSGYDYRGRTFFANASFKF